MAFPFHLARRVSTLCCTLRSSSPSQDGDVTGYKLGQSDENSNKLRSELIKIALKKDFIEKNTSVLPFSSLVGAFLLKKSDNMLWFKVVWVSRTPGHFV